MHPSVQVALQGEKLAHVVFAPHWPVVRHEHDRCLVGEHLHVFVDVLRPIQCIAHESSANWHQVVHGLRAVFRHAQPSEIGKEEVHFCRCFGFWRELENDAYSVDNKFLTRECDVFGWCKQRGWARRCCGTETAVHMPLGAARQERAELVGSTPSHCRASNDVFANGLLKEMHGRNNPALARIHFFFRRDAEYSAKMISVRMRVDNCGNWSMPQVLRNQFVGCSRSGLAGEWVDHNPALIALDKRDVRNVVATNLPHSLCNLEQAVMCVQCCMAPQMWVYGVGAVASVA